MSFGDDTLAPESAEERELRELREQNATIRREAGADESRCVVCGDMLHCSGDGLTCKPRPGGPCHDHPFQPESTLAAVQRVVRERDRLNATVNGTPEAQEIAETLRPVDIRDLAKLPPQEFSVRGTAKPEEG